jgi:tRNA pseudouridine38-40 synthase
LPLPDTPSTKLLLALAYIGKGYFGNQLQQSQGQPFLPTIQSELLTALSQLKLYPSNGKFAGRTDAGVHAQVQYFQCWVQSVRYQGDALVNRLNALLPKDITVWNAVYLTDAGRFDVIQFSN